MVAQLDQAYLEARPTKVWSRLLAYTFFEGRPLTTRGRWINPALFAFYHALNKVPQLKKVHRPVFLIGTGRSGTTILGVVLSIHKEIGFLNEPKALWHSAFGDEDLIGSYSSHPGHVELTERHASNEVSRRMRRLYGAFLRFSGSGRVLDKYPELVFRTRFVKALFPDAKFLFLHRNGWDTCTSINQWSQSHGSGGEDWWGKQDSKWQLLVSECAETSPQFAQHATAMRDWQDQRQRAAFEWIVSMLAGLAVAEAYPDDVLTVPYEKLCADPVEWMVKITEFADLVDDPVLMKFAKTRLKLPKPRDPFELAPELQAPFNEVMEKLGY